MNFANLNHVEYSFNGFLNRNKITSIDKLAALIPNGGQNHYVCWFRYQPELLRYVEERHEEIDKETGEVKLVHSVSEHNFAHYCDQVTWDIDRKDLEEARQNTIALVGKLVTLGIELEKIALFFSGAKGFHICVPSTLFDISPSPDLYRNVKKLCFSIADDISIDTGIYDKNRLFRLVNTCNGKSGLFKVHITHEMLNGSIEAILDYAKQPGPEVSLRNDYPVRKNLKALFDAAVKESEKSGNGSSTKQAGSSSAGTVPKYQKACISKLAHEGASAGHVHNASLRLVVEYLKMGMPYDAIIALMDTWAAKCDPPAKEDFGRMIEDCGSRGYDFGCNDDILTMYCTQECSFYKQPVSPDKYDIKKQRFSDTGISELVALHCAGMVCYWAEAGKWLFWDGRRWCSDMPGGMFPFIKRVVKQLFKYAIEIDDADLKKKTLQNILRLEGHYPQQTIIKAMENLPELIVPTSRLDADPMLLTCINGTLDLSSGNLRKHDQADMITRICNIEYDPTATCPQFEKFLIRIFDNNQNLIGYIQRFFGYCLTGRTDEQVMVFFYGIGANGKTTLLKLFLILLADFAASAQADLLMLKRDGGQSNDLARIRGTRLVAVNETNEGEKLDEAKLKTLTGGDTVTARFLFQEFFEYIPQFKLVLVGNHKPTIKGRDLGIWRRIHLIPFNVTIPEAERDPMLLEKLKAELPGILSWAVRGCLKWQQGGLEPPDEVLAAVQEYRASEDHFGQWLDEYCKRGDGKWSLGDELFQSFKYVTGLSYITATKFTRMLKEEGFIQERRFVGKCWIGVELKPKPTLD